MDDQTLTLERELGNPPGNGGILPVLSANDMRRLAEKADGWRRKNPTVVLTANGEVDVITGDTVKTETPLLRVQTDDKGNGLSRKVKIRIVVEPTSPTRSEGAGVSTDIDEADAVFVSQSSVSKFLLPYYMRFKDPKEVEDIENEVFGDGDVIGVIHLPGSSYAADRVGVLLLDKSGATKVKEFTLGQ